MTEETGYVLENETVAGIFLPVAESNNGFSNGSSSALKIFVTLVYTLLNPRAVLKVFVTIVIYPRESPCVFYGWVPSPQILQKRET